MTFIFKKDRWIGNHWASIEITPVDETYFLPLLTHLMTLYQFPLPTIIDSIDGYLTTFWLSGCETVMSIDTWSFSIAFEQDAVRDRVYEQLRQLPADYFK